MNVFPHKRFEKLFEKRMAGNKTLIHKFKHRLQLFLEDSKNSTLKDHALTGKLRGYRAFSISGDVRVIYKIVNNDLVLYDVGTHNQVYR